MAESYKFDTLDGAIAVFDDLPWRRTGSGKVSIFDAKKEEYVAIEKGQFIVSIADRYEVHDEEPEKAKPAEAPKQEPKVESKRESAPEGIKGPVTKTNENTE